MLDFSSNTTSKRKIDMLGISDMDISGEIDTYFGYLAPISKIKDKYPVSGGRFGFHVPVTLCH